MARQLHRHNFHEESEAAINRQINLELYSSYVYQSMSFHFNTVLKGFSKYFKKASDEERDHAEKFMEYQVQRGGRILLQDVKKPARDEWGTGLDAMNTALQLEKDVNQSLLDLHAIADKHNDYNFADWLESNFLDEQVEAMKEISDHIINLTNLSKDGASMAEYIFDKETLSE